ncbi:MAG TPA: FAD-binding protein, partial [Thauera aminoaromatica]|nr:FAD-binding protein [Thauera aminoaromatica]
MSKALNSLVDRVRAAREAHTPLAIRGAGTKSFYGERIRGTSLDTRDLSGISSYEPSELVLTARAGTPLADVEAALAERGQCLPFEPPRYPDPERPGQRGGTIGG